MTVTATYTQWRRARACHGKVPYSGQWPAENAATALGWKGRTGMTAYHCTWCAYWHVGHRRGT
jgi:hypothetical protein